MTSIVWPRQHSGGGTLPEMGTQEGQRAWAQALDMLTLKLSKSDISNLHCESQARAFLCPHLATGACCAVWHLLQRLLS